MQRPSTSSIVDDTRIKNLVGEALTSKEAMIRALEEELDKEKLRRNELSNKFKTQLQEFEEERDALERIRYAS